jgi:serine/threonine-protein kinase HipA
LEGLLPEGPQLEAILRRHKIDRGDCFGQLMAVGKDVVGSLTVEEPTQGEGGEG